MDDNIIGYNMSAHYEPGAGYGESASMLLGVTEASLSYLSVQASDFEFISRHPCASS